MEIKIAGNEYSFYTLPGQIRGIEKWTETTVKSQGGGGYIHPQHGGHISAPTITTSSKDHQSFWFVAHDGQEFKLNANDFSCREGQNSLILFGNLKNKKPYEMMAIKNLATNNVHVFGESISIFPEIWNSFKKDSFISFLFIIFLIIIFWLSGTFSGRDVGPTVMLIFFCSLIAVVIVIFRAHKINNKYENILKNTINDLNKFE